MDSARYVIIGAGLAGASTAYHLAQAGERDVLILEREDLPGRHASSQNAGMVRQIVEDPEIAALAREGASFIRDHDAAWNLGFRPNGSLLLTSRAERGRLVGERMTADEAVARVPVLRGADFEEAVWSPTDGVVDVSALLRGYLGGARVLTGAPVSSIDGDVVRTPRGAVRAEIVVNAAGAWAGDLAHLAGASPFPIAPFRRHLFHTGPLDGARADWPFVWDVPHGVYFRPESGGLLLSPCDEDRHLPGVPSADPKVTELLATKLARHVPELAGIPIAKSWAGLRTIAPDRRFVIGWEPRRRGFLWVAGLGGHGVTTSAAVGRLAADLLRAGPAASHPAFDPAR